MLDSLQSVATLPSALEAVAVVLAVAYLLLAIRESIWCWPCSAVSALIFAAIVFERQFYMSALLYLYFFAAATYGWFVWRRHADSVDKRPVVRWSLGTHAIAIATIVVISVVSGYVLGANTDARFATVDALLTWGSVWTTFLVARKVLENWWYWLVIDVISVVVYALLELPLTALLFVLYLAMIPFGMASWTRSWRQATA